MAQDSCVKGCSMRIPHLLEAEWFCFWKTHFETYIKFKDIDLWQVIQNSDFVFMMDEPETKMEVETPYELLKDDQMKQLSKNNEAKMTIYNSLPLKDCKIDLITQQYENFSISNEETIDNGFTRFNAIVTSLKSLYQNYSSKNHVRKFLRALPLKWRAKVYEMILENDGVASKTTKENVKSLALKAKVTSEQTSDDSDSQGGSDENADEKEAKAFNLMARNFQKGNRFGHGNRFGNGANRFGRGRGNNFGNKGRESSRQRRGCYNCREEGHFIGECPKPKENKAFVGGDWSDSEDRNEPQNDVTCLMAAESHKVSSKPSTFNNDLVIIDLQKENDELLRFNKDFTKTFEKL
ncbi:zf-CCHC domain-containing protein [Tanacetum coccineum]